MQFRTFEDLHRTIVKNLHKVPADVDLIIGIPRSGLMAANILAIHLHLPVTDLNRFLEGKTISSGDRLNGVEKDSGTFKHALVVDDSLHTGKAMKRTMSKLCGSLSDTRFTTAAVYINPASVTESDIYFEQCPVPRVFEWNIMNHQYLEHACVDIDGVLCADPTPDENDDGENYIRFLESAKPLLRCRKKIGYLVTNRLEKYRSHTENWLLRHGIKYNQLIMQNLPDQETRRKLNNYGRYKAEAYVKFDHTKIFIESSYRQAREIADISGKMVYCVDKRIMIRPGIISKGKRRTRKIKRKIASKLFQIGSIFT